MGQYLVALGAEGVVRVAAAWLAALTAGNLPVVGRALVAVGSHHVGQAEAPPGLVIAGLVLACPLEVAGAFCKAKGLV